MVHVESSESPKRHHSNSFLVTITAVLALISKQASRLKPKPKFAPTKSAEDVADEKWKIELRTPPPKSPLRAPKKLLSNISSKALSPFGQNHNHNKNKKHGGEGDAAEGWGNGGVWQKEILMGGKCEPLDFSGVIYYDINGKQVREMPLRSPRASPLPGYLTRQRPPQSQSHY